MPQMIAALLGTAAGPWVYTKNFKKPKVRVSGLRGTVTIVQSELPNMEEGTAIAVDADGDHVLPVTSKFTRIFADGDVSKLCCKIVE